MTTVHNKTNPCPRCKHPEFTKGKAFDGRPDFQCTACGHSWTCGHSGGEYLKAAKRVTQGESHAE
jgi:transposase-like protein